MRILIIPQRQTKNALSTFEIIGGVTFALENNLTSDEFEAYTKLLIVALWKGGYSHEIIACLFNKCFVEGFEIMDEEGDLKELQERKIWPPRRIVKEIANIPLEELCKRLKEDYIADSSLPEELVNDCFKLLELKMHTKVSEVINPFDRSVQKRWAGILEKSVGETLLRDYFGETPEDNIADWSYRVLKKVKKFLVENNWLERPIEELLKEDP